MIWRPTHCLESPPFLHRLPVEVGRFSIGASEASSNEFLIPVAVVRLAITIVEQVVEIQQVRSGPCGGFIPAGIAVVEQGISDIDFIV